MTQSPVPQEPIQLNYGRQAPAWRRRKTIVTVVLIVGLIAGGYFAQKPVGDWLEFRAYRREAARWYTTGLAWSEPPTKLKYTENPADAPNGKFNRSYGRAGATTYTGFKSFGGAFVERLPLFTGDGKPILAGSPDEIMLFMHQRRTANGMSRLIAIGGPRFSGDKLGIEIAQIGPLNGDYRILHGGYRDLNMSGIAGPGEIRIFAGQTDANDPAKFSIPFEARGRRGWIDGVFEEEESSSTNPVHIKIEREANAQVKLTIRMEPATQPSTSPAN